MQRFSFPDLLTLAGWLAVLTPFAILFGKAPPDYTLSLVSLLFLIEKIRTRDFAWVKKPWIAVLLGLWAYGTIHTTLLVGFNIEGAGWFRFILFAVALAEWILPHEIWRKRLALSALGVTTFLALDALFQFFVGFDIIGRPRLGDRLTSVFRMPKVGLNLAWFFVPLMVWLWTEKKEKLAIGYGAVCFSAVLLSGDRFALLYTLSTLALLSVLEPRLRKPALFGWAGIAVLFVAVFSLFPDMRARQFDSIIHTITNLPESHYGLIWKSTIGIFEKNWLLGVGNAYYKVVCPDPVYGPLYVGPANDLVRCVLHPHQMYLEIASEMGVVGLGLFFAFIAVAGLQIFRHIGKNGGQPLVLALGLALMMRLFPLASSSSFYTAWAAMPFWLYLGWAMAMCNKKGG